MVNPLLLPVLDALRRQPSGLSEYALLKQVEAALPPLAEAAELALFQKHFLVMNALYQLQMTLWQEERLWLSISPLAIELRSIEEQPDRQALQPGGEDRLRDYYLDWAEFERTGGDEVRELLDGFWRRFHAVDKLQAAFAVLALEPTTDWAGVQAQYRRLARATHPDHGGDAQRFLEVRAAYELLRDSMS
jgi:DnaJ-domain-containing protein 1